MFRKLTDWLNLADLDKARNAASLQIITRYARGNTSIQDGRSMNKCDLARLSALADEAMYRLRLAIRH